MFENELSESIKEIKDPERKINLWTAAIIVVSLVAVIVFLFKLNQNANESSLQDSKDCKVENLQKQRAIDSLNNLRLQDVKDQLRQQEMVNALQNSNDSMKIESRKIIQALTSK